MTIKITWKSACLALISLLGSCYPIKPIQRVTLPPQKLAPVSVIQPAAKPPNEIKDSFLMGIFKKYPLLFDSIILQAQQRNIQVIFTRIDRGANNLPSFTDFTFNVHPDQYFYPASTVKLPAALLALQKVRELAATGISANTTMITEAGYSGQTATYNDPNSTDGKPTIAGYIKKIFLVSDNNAFNRIYEFLGGKYINAELARKGYSTAQLIHRLDIALSEDENRHTNPLKFYTASGSLAYSQPAAFNESIYPVRKDVQGRSYFKNDSLINAPMDFSKKNRISLMDLHQVLRSVMFPNSVPASRRFNLSPDDYNFVYQYLSEYPAESVFPYYDSAVYPRSFVKFYYEGLPVAAGTNIRIFDKCGEAYGQLSDIAYVADFDHKIEFFISATINCTKNGVINNDDYDYDSVGYPFFKSLAKVLYEYELSRPRKFAPDLSSFKINYNK